MEIDSSDEEEEAAENTGSVLNPCERHLQSGLQSTVNRCLTFSCMKYVSCCVLLDSGFSFFHLLNHFGLCTT